ncbi:MAG: NUDIX hydrolase [Bacteroidota bacterium]
MRRDIDELVKGKNVALRFSEGNQEDEQAQYLIPLEDFFQFGLSVDCILFGFDGQEIKILLIERGVAPYKSYWALPGDLVYPNEDLNAAAQRVLENLTGIRDVFMQQIKTFGKTDRHPLGRVITVAFIALIRVEHYETRASSWADNVRWFTLPEVGELAFDHNDILNKGVEKLKSRVRREPLGFELLPINFTLNQLQKLYEAILDRPIDKRNFRKKILAMNFLVKLDEKQTKNTRRPACLYTFDQTRYGELLDEGFTFEI